MANTPPPKFKLSYRHQPSYLALSMASVLCTLLSWPRQKRSPPEGSTYPSTVTMGQVEGTLNVSPTCTSISK